MDTQLKPPDPTRVYTIEEFETLPEFNDRYELVEGKLVKKSVPGFEHALIAEIIREALRVFDPDRKLGLMLQESSVRVGPEYAPIPDLSFWKANRRPKRTKGVAPLPDLVVEIWSPGDLDSNKNREAVRDKIKRYLEAGILLVWVINPARQSVEVYRPGQFEPVILETGQELEGEDITPGFKLSVKTLFEDED